MRGSQAGTILRRIRIAIENESHSQGRPPWGDGGKKRGGRFLSAKRCGCAVHPPPPLFSIFTTQQKSLKFFIISPQLANSDNLTPPFLLFSPEEATKLNTLILASLQNFPNFPNFPINSYPATTPPPLYAKRHLRIRALSPTTSCVSLKFYQSKIP